MPDVQAPYTMTAQWYDLGGGVYGTTPPDPLGTILFEDDFSSGDFSNGWGAVGSQLSVVTGEGRPFAAKCAYDGTSGTAPFLLTIPNSQLGANLEELYIEYDMKWDAFVNCKGLKIHGQVDPGPSKANTTLNNESDGGLNIQFGDGTQLDNDTQSGCRADTGFYNYTLGGEVEEVLTPDTDPLTKIPFNNTWYSVRARIKFGTNKDARTEFYVNGNPKVIVHSYSNKNVSNPPIDRVTFFDFTAGGDIGNGFVANVKVLSGGWSS